jgi:hypothetical protein
MKCETGWGDSVTTRALREAIYRHPTPPLLSVASTLPLQGRVKGGYPPRAFLRFLR